MTADRRRTPWGVAAALALVTGALYARAATFGFVHFDDNRYLTENPVVQAGLTWRGVAWAFTAVHASNWHPLTWLSHMLDVQLFGMSPGAHHAVNVLLHAANAALLLVVLARMTGAPWRSAVVAALFAVHPLHVESVAWVAERKDVLSTFFGLLALLAYARHAERPGPRRLAVVAALFAASLLAKPMWVTLPFLLLLLDFWPLRRVAGADGGEGGLPGRSWRELALEKLPLLALSVASSAVTVVAQHRGGALAGLDLGLGPRLSNAAVSYLEYLGKVLWPSPLSIFYPYRPIPAWKAAAAVLVLLAATAGALALARRLPWLAVGWCWFVGMLVPVIGLVQVGSQSLADRYTYVPIVGLFVAVVWGAHRLLACAGPAIPALLAAAALLALGATTWRQLGHWSTHEALFQHALEVDPENGVAHGALSEGLREQRRFQEALAHAREAVRLEPGSVRHWNNLGVSLRELGQLAEARDALQAAVQVDPRHASSWINLALVEQDLGDPAAAAADYERAAQAAPDSADPWFRLASLLARTGRADDAVMAYQEAVARDPGHFGAWTNLAVLQQGTGRTREAVTAFEAATRAEPRNWVGWRNLGIALFKAGAAGDAAGAFREAVRLRPDDLDLLRRLALASASAGARDEALSIAARLEPADPRAAAEIRASVAQPR
jgi:tetratricopeptide (TPR) repeat protein